MAMMQRADMPGVIATQIDRRKKRECKRDKKLCAEDMEQMRLPRTAGHELQESRVTWMAERFPATTSLTCAVCGTTLHMAAVTKNVMWSISTSKAMEVVTRELCLCFAHKRKPCSQVKLVATMARALKPTLGHRESAKRLKLQHRHQ